jgi:hypothetical protein
LRSTSTAGFATAHQHNLRIVTHSEVRFMLLKSCIVCATALTLLVQSIERVPAQNSNTKYKVIPPPSPIKRRVRSLKLEDQIVGDAKTKIGMKIGGGECTDFVNEVLIEVHAKTSTNVKVPTFHDKTLVMLDSYGWGRKVVALGAHSKPVEPKAGYIIQFESCVFKNGSSTWTLGIPHHTSIVESAVGRTVTLLHQNMEGGDLSKSKVREDTIDLTGLQSGSFLMYIAVPAQ